MDNTNPPPEQFCAAPGAVFADGSDFVCVRRADGETVRITNSQYAALQSVNDFKPFAEHVASLSESDIGQFVQRLANKFHMSPSAGQRFARTLKEWRENGTVKGYGKLSNKRAAELVDLHAKGLLLSDRDLLASLLNAGQDPDPEVKIRYICIPTANRPERLAVCLQSFIQNLEKNGRTDTAIFVIEDGEDQNNKDLVKAAQANTPVRVEHFGLQHRTTMMDALTKRTAVPRDVIEFALALPKVQKTAMPARNAFTLMTLGNYIFQTDDDTRCAYTTGGKISDATYISATNEPCECWFYPDHESLLRERALNPDFNILSAHEELLGKTVASAVRRSPNVQWKQAHPEMLVSLQSGAGNVGMTSTGCAGDSGLYASGSYLFTSTDETMARMCASAESYRTALHSGKLLRVPMAKYISRGEYFQGMSYAVDNTCLQPPSYPMGRNADGSSALLYLLSDSESWIAHLPWAIYHNSDTGRRAYVVEHTEQFSRLRLNDIVIFALRSSAAQAPVKRSQALFSMGEQLIALGELPARSFKAYVRAEFVRSQLATAKYLESQMAVSPKFSLLEQDLRTILANLKKSVSTENSIVPLDLEAEVGVASALEFAQKSLKSFGQVMRGWEELCVESQNMICTPA